MAQSLRAWMFATIATTRRAFDQIISFLERLQTTLPIATRREGTQPAIEAVATPNLIGQHADRHGLAKLNDEAVADIRRRYAAGGISQAKLAEEYGVGQTKISAVVNRRTWRHIMP
jgi:hypothetical protein